ncbi:zinc ribbon domain-containing protein [Laspinema olomoucense]|uniref:Zinc ribbon domain-containing protein n=1 Tax=Laspinema olomoucense D3b TaxID=2953688 RepID=A0ABT2N5Q1_9CYAN|nr:MULTISPECIES: zinc ribbon domain-containing protein [unclassified Laspinema]MCT7970818.1 zinc ribbon domain-containing protein [Laspinema sp. D3d]MCT7978024.1 zinc ribbon domain-containing protein [Laspinema sp. D3b]MCT7988941.1 zinc ribbon domain-containing protein [Laspinema sp. D3a]MCT7993758.1 zinc ribbon domain-containing protein [Laspinema sp. D3c]
MSDCPQCHQSVDVQAVKCPYCQTPLKGFGHPGIPLHQANSEEFLCDSCTYHEDDTCNYPQRPYAKTCTLYHDKSQPLVPVIHTPYSQSGSFSGLNQWVRRHPGSIAVVAIALISLFLALR